MMRRLNPLLCLLSLMMFSVSSHAQTELDGNASYVLSVPAVQGNNISLSNEFFVNVPSTATALIVRLSGVGEGRDLDLFGRVGGVFSNTANFNQLVGESNFRAISFSGDEQFIAQDFAIPDVRGQSVFLAIVGFAGNSTDVTLTLEFDAQPPPPAIAMVDFNNNDADPSCLTEPWFDTTPVSPADGNSGTTLGEQRRIAAQFAFDAAVATLTSRMPITIAACWESLGLGNGNGFSIAGARPADFNANSPGLGSDNFFARPVYERLAGAESCQISGGSCGSADIEITFNLDVETLAEDRRYFYGLNATAPSSRVDFIYISTHEITHGLGFTGTLGEDGSLIFRADINTFVTDSYSEHLLWQRGSNDIVPLTSTDLTDADRVLALSDIRNVFWGEDRANITKPNTRFRDPSLDGRLIIFSPAEFSAGSSIYHLNSDYCTLMTPFNRFCEGGFPRTLGVEAQMLEGVGWHDKPNDSPFNGFYFDVDRDGHGFEFVPAGVNGSGETVYVLTFYSYDIVGQPEWFQAIGVIREGAFIGERNEFSDSLVRFRFDEADSPPQSAIASSIGQGVLSFNNPNGSRACDGRDGLAAFQWRLGSSLEEWCVKPLIPETLRPEIDFSGLWFAGVDDQGWGLSIAHFLQGSEPSNLFIVLYVYADDGRPVWYFGLAEDFVAGQSTTIDLFQRDGYDRTLTSLPLVDQIAGQMVVTMQTPSQSLDAGNFIDSLSVEFQDLPGGTWERNQIPIQRLSTESAPN